MKIYYAIDERNRIRTWFATTEIGEQQYLEIYSYLGERLLRNHFGERMGLDHDIQDQMLLEDLELDTHRNSTSGNPTR
jgi:hypothetical protein